MSTNSEMGERLKRAREAAKYKSAAKAAEAMGVPYGTYSLHENGARGFRDSLERYAQFYRVSIEWLLTGKGEGPKRQESQRPMPPPGHVRLMGRVGAGQSFMPLDEEPYEYVGAPAGVPETTEAVEVDGNSMFPAYENRSIIYFSKTLPPEMMVNKRAVIRLADGSMTVKVLRPGSGPGLWNLQSINAQFEDIPDVVVEWAAPIDWVKPA